LSDIYLELSNLCICHLTSIRDIVSTKGLTLIPKSIGQCEVKNSIPLFYVYFFLIQMYIQMDGDDSKEIIIYINFILTNIILLAVMSTYDR